MNGLCREGLWLGITLAYLYSVSVLSVKHSK